MSAIADIDLPNPVSGRDGKPLRVLHLLDHSLPLQSGYAFRTAALLREQRALGWEIAQLTTTKQGACKVLREEVGGIEYHRTAPSKNRWARLPVLDQISVITTARQRLREVIAEVQPDILQAHSPCLTALAAFGLGKPVVYELRSSWEDAAVSNGQTTEGSLRYRLSRALETYVLRRADAITTICEGLRTDVIGRGVAPDRVSLIPNAVDVDRFANRARSTVDIRARYQLQDKAVIGFAGSFYAWEGLPLLIEALPLMLRERSDVRVLLVGAGPNEAMIRAAVERYGMGSHVIFAGQVKQAEVDAYYDAMDLLVYPRLPMRLTDMVTPLKPLEAMALSKLFIASDVGGHRELVQHGKTGMLFKAGDANALAQSALSVLGDADLRQRMTVAGLKFVREERTWTRSAAGYRAVYGRLLQAKR